MADRLRELIDVVLGTLDEPGVDGRALADRVHFSRDHLDRLLSAATGETPVAMRRRLLLERAAWELEGRRAPVAEVAMRAGYGSAAAFSRAFARAYGVPPRAFATAAGPRALDGGNGIHFHAPAGLSIADGRASGPPGARDLTERLLRHHLARTREVLVAASALAPADLAAPLRPGLVVLEFEGEEASAGLMAQRLVVALEVWVAAMAGLEHDQATAHLRPLLERFDRAADAFARLVRTIARRGAWDDAFVDALCEPPQSFTYGGVVAHVLTFGAIRREALAGVLTQLGVRLASSDPILWEESER